MSKVRTFSRSFPSYHPNAGQPTFFVEKFLKSFESQNFYADAIYEMGQKLGYSDVDQMLNMCDSVDPKYHTVRSGKHFKAADVFSPRFWSGAPYKSKQIVIAPDIEIKKVWDISLEFDGSYYAFRINGNIINVDQERLLAKNDGLSHSNLLCWFNKPFEGQIICWSDKVNY